MKLSNELFLWADKKPPESKMSYFIEKAVSLESELEEAHSANAVDEGMYSDKCGQVIALQSALNEVYAVAGEVNGVEEIVSTALKYE